MSPMLSSNSCILDPQQEPCTVGHVEHMHTQPLYVTVWISHFSLRRDDMHSPMLFIHKYCGQDTYIRELGIRMAAIHGAVEMATGLHSAPLIIPLQEESALQHAHAPP